MDGLLDMKPARVCFEVEKIIGVSGDGNVRNYQVQWAPAWVSSFHLIGCEHLIQEFLQKQTHTESQRLVPQEHFANSGTADEVSEFQQSPITSQLVVDDSHAGEWGSCRRFPGQASERLGDIIENSKKSWDNNISSHTDTVIKVEEGDGLQHGHSDELIETNSDLNISTVGVSQRSEPPEVSNSAFLGSSIGDKAQHEPEPDPKHQHNGSSRQRTLSYETVNSSTSYSIPHGHFNEPRFLTNHSKTKRYNCSVCDKEFNHRNDLRIHHRKHTGAKPYHCSVCGKQFSDGSNMKRHMRIHSGVRPYTCSVCGKACSQKVHLQNHMRTHTGANRYSCAVCGDLFPTGSHLKMHLLVHEEEP